MQGHLSQQRRNAAPSFLGQPSPNRRRQIAHRGIQANAPTRTALATPFSVIRYIPSNYERCRGWDIELLFKWIKQNLRIRHFYGASENAVKTQIWTAACVYLIAAVIKEELALDVSLYTLLS